MLRKVMITENSSSHLIAEYLILLEVVDPTNEDYCDETWENAVDDGLVDAANRADYKLKLYRIFCVDKNITSMRLPNSAGFFLYNVWCRTEEFLFVLHNGYLSIRTFIMSEQNSLVTSCLKNPVCVAIGSYLFFKLLQKFDKNLALEIANKLENMKSDTDHKK